MKDAADIDILVSEVGPRDGLQSVKAIMSTELKLEWISALAKAGLREIEVGSFVSPSYCRKWPTARLSWLTRWPCRTSTSLRWYPT